MTSADSKLPSAPKKRGPKPRPAEEQLSQLTVRLSPKLKYGLDLLARAQHRSLSQAIEWALQVGLNGYEIGYESEPLSDVSERAWSAPTEMMKLLILYASAPQLLEFEEAAACELVSRSDEHSHAEPTPDVSLQDDGKPNWGERLEESWNKAKEVGKIRSAIYWAFCEAVWPEIRRIATTKANSGQTLSECLLIRELGIDLISPDYATYFAMMEHITKLAPKPFDHGKWRAIVADVNKEIADHMEAQRIAYLSRHKEI